MAIQMTRAQYEATYGVKPVISASTLDTTPAPIQMTRAEYNAKYRPQSTRLAPLSERLADVGLGAQERASQAIEGEGENIGKSAIERGVEAAAAYSSVVPQGGYEILTSTPVIGKPIKKAVDFLTEKIGQGFNVVTDNLSDTNLIKGAAGTQTTDPTTGAVTYTPNKVSVEPLSNVLSGTGEIAGNILAAEGVRYTAEKAPQLAKAFTEQTKALNDRYTTYRNDARVSNIANEIEAIENKYVPTRRKADADPTANESRLRIAQSNVLNNAVDEDGLIRTKTRGGAVDAYRAQTIDGVEDVVKRNLEVEGKKINLNEIRGDMYDAVTKSGLEGADLTKAIKGIEAEIQGLALRADEFGDVLLSKIQDAKTSIYKHIDYTKPTGVTYRKTLARVYKETIENKSDLPVKDWNAELAKYYKDLDRLADLDGKRVKGGRLGKYTAQLAGTALGGLGGSVAGAGGAVIGGIAGGELSSFLAGKAMSRTFRQGTKGDIPENQVLADAKARADAGQRDLTTPDPQVGASKTILADMPEAIKKEVSKVEGQIKDNIKQQKTAIKAGDFTLVEALKDVYQVLVERLKQIIADYKKMSPRDKQGGFVNFGADMNQRKNDLISDQNQAIAPPTITQNISPTVPKIDAEVKSNIVRILDDYTLNKEPDLELQMDASKIAEDLGIKLPKTYGALVKKLGEVLDEAEAPRTVTPQTTPLLEEAKKYKSAEEFVKAQGEIVFRGGNKSFDKTLIGEDGVFVTPSKFMAETFGKNVDELVISPKARVLSYENLPDSIKAIDNWDDYSKAVSRYGREQGVDVIDSLPPKADFPRGMERTVINPDVLQTKSQLTDIWKQANK